MFKRILVVFGIAALAIGSTWAYFSATADSADNVVTAGTLEFGTPTPAVWTSGNMAPGDFLTGNYSMDNAGTIDAEHLEIATTNSGDGLQDALIVTTMLYGYDSNDDGDVSDEDPGNWVDIIQVITSGAPDADYSLQLERNLNGTQNVSAIDSNGDDLVTLAELAQLDDLGEPVTIEVRGNDNNQGLAAAPESWAAFYARLDLPAGTENEYQGKSNTLTWLYTLNQDASQ